MLDSQGQSSPSHQRTSDRRWCVLRRDSFAHETPDGLAVLPAVELRPEGEPYKPPSRSPLASVSPEGTSGQTTLFAPEFPLELLTDYVKPQASSIESTDDSRSPEGSDPLHSVVEALEQTTSPELFRTSDSLAAPECELGVIDPAISSPTRIVNHDSKLAAPSQARSSSSGADLILPIIIFAVVMSNPPQLASQLMFLRRYRSAICLTGEASYAIVNLTAVIGFLEHVDFAELGLGEHSGKVIRYVQRIPGPG